MNNAKRIPGRRYSPLKSGKHIGVISPCYGLEKVSYGIEPGGYEFCKVDEIPLKKIFKGDYYKNCPYLVPNTASLIHTFNKIPLSNHNFIMSFEMEIPRLFDVVSGDKYKKACDVLASDRCKGLYSLSEIAAKQAIDKFSKSGYSEIGQKISVFRGSVDFFDASRFDQSEGEKIKLLFIGNDIVRKGLIAACRAVEKLNKVNDIYTLDIISNLSTKSYVNFDDQYVQTELEYIRKLDFVNFLGKVPNEQVRRKLSESDLLLFPSIDESLGWVVIEAGLSATPSLALNMFAINELVDEKTGFIIDIETDENHRWIHLSDDFLGDKYSELQNNLAEAIFRRLNAVGSKRDILMLGLEAKRKMKELYGLSKAKNNLREIYKRAISNA